MVRLYDTSNPYKWKYYKSLTHPSSSWTITDASLSPDNRKLAYSSIASTVCLASTDPAKDEYPLQLDFAYMGRSGTRRRGLERRGSFGVCVSVEDISKIATDADLPLDMVDSVFWRWSGDRSWDKRSLCLCL